MSTIDQQIHSQRFLGAFYQLTDTSEKNSKSTGHCEQCNHNVQPHGTAEIGKFIISQFN